MAKLASGVGGFGVSGKVVVLKPMVWNAEGYVRPDGTTRKGDGYVARHGFGHEEWNADPNRLWRGQRIFHTETTNPMKASGTAGDLGIIMTTYLDRTTCALGIATSVTANTPEDKRAIFDALRLLSDAEKLWELPSVKAKHPSLDEFRTFWFDKGIHNSWRCPPSEFLWFREKVPLDPKTLFPPKAEAKGVKAPTITWRHSKSMSLRQDQARAIVQDVLEPDSPILSWLSTGAFDHSAMRPNTRSSGEPKRSQGDKSQDSAAPTDKAYIRYLRQQEILVPPRHSDLQKRFESFLKNILNAPSIRPNVDGVDIQFECRDKGLVFAELKPCTVQDARYAIRTAIGQLCDYRHNRPRPTPALLVVLEVKPNDHDRDLALSNGIGVAHPKGEGFRLHWPNSTIRSH